MADDKATSVNQENAKATSGSDALLTLLNANVTVDGYRAWVIGDEGYPVPTGDIYKAS